MKTFQNKYDLELTLAREQNPAWSEEMTTLDTVAWLKCMDFGSNQQFFLIWEGNKKRGTSDQIIEIANLIEGVKKMTEPVYQSKDGWVQSEDEQWQQDLHTLDTFNGNPAAGLMFIFTVMMPDEMAFDEGLMEIDANIIEKLNDDILPAFQELDDAFNDVWTAYDTGTYTDPQVKSELEGEISQAITDVDAALLEMSQDPDLSGETNLMNSSVNDLNTVLVRTGPDATFSGDVIVDGQQTPYSAPYYDPSDSYKVWDYWTGENYNYPSAGDENYQAFTSDRERWSDAMDDLLNNPQDLAKQEQGAISQLRSEDQQLQGTTHDGFKNWIKGQSTMIQNQKSN